MCSQGQQWCSHRTRDIRIRHGTEKKKEGFAMVATDHIQRPTAAAAATTVLQQQQQQQQQQQANNGNNSCRHAGRYDSNTKRFRQSLPEVKSPQDCNCEIFCLVREQGHRARTLLLSTPRSKCRVWLVNRRPPWRRTSARAL